MAVHGIWLCESKITIHNANNSTDNESPHVNSPWTSAPHHNPSAKAYPGTRPCGDSEENEKHPKSRQNQIAFHFLLISKFMGFCRAGATDFGLEPLQSCPWLGLSSKRALGGRGPFLSEPTFIPYDVIRILQGRGLHRPAIAMDGYSPRLTGWSGQEKSLEPGYGHGHEYIIFLDIWWFYFMQIVGQLIF